MDDSFTDEIMDNFDDGQDAIIVVAFAKIRVLEILVDTLFTKVHMDEDDPIKSANDFKENLLRSSELNMDDPYENQVYDQAIQRLDSIIAQIEANVKPTEQKS